MGLPENIPLRGSETRFRFRTSILKRDESECVLTRVQFGAKLRYRR